MSSRLPMMHDDMPEFHFDEAPDEDSTMPSDPHEPACTGLSTQPALNEQNQGDATMPSDPQPHRPAATTSQLGLGGQGQEERVTAGSQHDCCSSGFSTPQLYVGGQVQQGSTVPGGANISQAASILGGQRHENATMPDAPLNPRAKGSSASQPILSADGQSGRTTPGASAPSHSSQTQQGNGGSSFSATEPPAASASGAPAGTATLNATARLPPRSSLPAYTQANPSQPKPTRSANDASSFSSKRSSAALQDDDDCSSEEDHAERRVSHFGAPWTDKEDAILNASVKRHGTNWDEAAKFFNRSSQTTRTAGGLEKRWSRLLAKTPRRSTQHQKASAPSASTSQVNTTPHRRLPAASASTSSSNLQNPPAWTDEEFVALQRIFARHQRASGDISWDDVYEDFLAKFPATSRSRDAVRRKCSTIHSAYQHGVNALGNHEHSTRRTAVSASMAPPSTHNANSSGHLINPETRPVNAEGFSAHLSDNQQPFSGSLAGASGIGSQHAVAPSLAQAPMRRQPRTQQHEGPAHPAASQHQDVVVAHEVNGVTIRCPRGSEIRVLSPSYVRVSRLGSASTSLDEDFEPAFHLKVLEDGSVSPVRLPPGTTASVVAAASSGQGTNAGEIKWRGPSGYWVCIRSSG